MIEHETDPIHGDIEDLAGDLWQVPGFMRLRTGFRPHVDCYRTERPPAVTLIVDLAGVDPDRVEIDVTERTVVVRGERRRPELDCRVSYRQMEIEYGPFRRRIALAEDVDPEQAIASYEGGLLKVVMPLARKPRSGRVSIELGRRP